MNAKQLAALVLIVAVVLVGQVGLSLRKQAESAAKQADKEAQELKTAEAQLKNEKDYYEGQLKDAKSLVRFAEQWKPEFAVIEDQNDAETGISMKVRAGDLVNLSQRYELVPYTINNKPNETIPLMVRATLLFEDNYAKLISWIGEMEKTKPTMRAGRAAMTAGSRGSDIRMELVLEVPLKKPVTK